jgi:transposase
MADRVWSEKDLVRRANRRLAVLQHADEVSGNVAATCRYYGISRNVFYRWKRLYEDEGLEGLKDRSSAPLYCPTVTHPEVVEKIIHLRQHYHFGPMKIRMYLKRYHDVEISASGVWRILKRLRMNRLPASQRYKRHTGRWKRYATAQRLTSGQLTMAGIESQPRTVDVRDRRAMSRSTRHSGNRLSTSSSATRASRRARGAPTQKWAPRPKVRCWPGFRWISKRSGSSKQRSSRLAEASMMSSGLPAGTVWFWNRTSSVATYRATCGPGGSKRSSSSTAPGIRELSFTSSLR